MAEFPSFFSAEVDQGLLRCAVLCLVPCNMVKCACLYSVVAVVSYDKMLCRTCCQAVLCMFSGLTVLKKQGGIQQLKPAFAASSWLLDVCGFH